MVVVIPEGLRRRHMALGVESLEAQWMIDATDTNTATKLGPEARNHHPKPSPSRKHQAGKRQRRPSKQTRARSAVQPRSLE